MVHGTGGPLLGLRRVLAVPPNPYYFDPRLDRLVERLCSETQPPSWVLNIGSGTTSYGRRTLNLDLEPFANVQICADGQRLPFRDHSMSGAVLRGVLEHVRSAERVRDEIRRILAPGSFLYVEVPFLQPYHSAPEDYRRFTLPGLRAFLEMFDELEAGIQIGPGSALAWVLRESLACFLSVGSAGAYRKFLAAIGWCTFWLKYLDRWIVPAPHAAHSASAVYFLGRRCD